MKIIVVCKYGTFVSRNVQIDQREIIKNTIIEIQAGRKTLSFDTDENETVFFTKEILADSIIRLKY